MRHPCTAPVCTNAPTHVSRFSGLAGGADGQYVNLSQFSDDHRRVRRLTPCVRVCVCLASAHQQGGDTMHESCASVVVYVRAAGIEGGRGVHVSMSVRKRDPLLCWALQPALTCTVLPRVRTSMIRIRL